MAHSVFGARRMRSPRLRTALMRMTFTVVLLVGTMVLAVVADERPSWPPPPAEPRIQFLQSFSEPGDIGLKRRGIGQFLRDVLFGPEPDDLVRPFGLAAADQRLFVADTGAGVVHVYDFDSLSYDQLATVRDEPLISPIAVAIAPNGNIMIADSERREVFVFDNALRFQYSFGLGESLGRPTGIACTADRVYVSDTVNHRVLVYSWHERNAQFLFAFGERGVSEGSFNFPVDIAVSAQHLVYVNDSMNFRVQVFDSDGRYIRSIGSAGNSSGHFQRSKGLALDSDGNLYVADALADTVQIFDSQGRFLLNFGHAGRADGEFWLPAGVAIDEQDRLFVADSYNGRVQMFQYQTGGEQ